ncbi:MAG: SIS domain-containing protein [Burkholderiales bacterium]
MSAAKRLRVAVDRTAGTPVAFDRRTVESPAPDARTISFAAYAQRLAEVLVKSSWSAVADLAEDLLALWKRGGTLFICGNGGSAGNAIHLANDFLYGIAKTSGLGMRVQALSANASVLTCLANDMGYEHIFSAQLAVQARKDDILLAFSGSGNSSNIVRALEQARDMSVKTYAVLGYGGGECKGLADVPIHFAVDDMQISEDMQLVIGHMLMQWLSQRGAQP